MRLTKVTIHNFKSISHLSLHPLSFTAITGLNGTGKSNIIDAITFITSFSNKEMRVSKISELIRNGENECWVELTFVMKYALYQKIMALKGKAQTQKEKGQLSENHQEGKDEEHKTKNSLNIDEAHKRDIFNRLFTESSENVTLTVKKEIVGSMTRTYLNNNLITQARLAVLLSHFQLLIVRQGTITKMVNNGLAVLLYESIGADPELLRSKMETLEKKEKKLNQLKNEKLRMIRPYFEEMQRIKVQMRENMLNERMIDRINEEISLLEYVLNKYGEQKQLVISREIADLQTIMKKDDQTAERLKLTTQLKLKVLECKEELKSMTVLKHTCPKCSEYERKRGNKELLESREENLSKNEKTSQEKKEKYNRQKQKDNNGPEYPNGPSTTALDGSQHPHGLQNIGVPSKIVDEKKNIWEKDEKAAEEYFSLQSLPFYTRMGTILGQSNSTGQMDISGQTRQDLSGDISNFVRELKEAVDCLTCQAHFMRNFISALDVQDSDIRSFINELEVNIQLKEEKRSKLQLDEQRSGLMGDIRGLFKEICAYESFLRGDENTVSQEGESALSEREIISESHRLVGSGGKIEQLVEIPDTPQNVDLLFTYGRVFENYTVQDRYTTAIDALLLNKRNFIITESSDITGHGTFIPLDKIIVSDHTGRGNYHHDGNSALNYIQFDQKMLPAFKFLLGNFHVVDPEAQQTKDIKRLIAQHKQAKQVCVLLDGTVIDYRGVMTGGKIVIRKEQGKFEIVQQIKAVSNTINRNIQVLSLNGTKTQLMKKLSRLHESIEQLLSISDSFDIKIKDRAGVDKKTIEMIRNELSELPDTVNSLNEEIRSFNEKQRTIGGHTARLQALLTKYDAISQAIGDQRESSDVQNRTQQQMQRENIQNKTATQLRRENLQHRTAPQLRRDLIDQKSRLLSVKDSRIQMAKALQENANLIDQTEKLLEKQSYLQNYISENEKESEMPETIDYEKRKEIKRKMMQLESELVQSNKVSQDSSDHTGSSSKDESTFKTKSFLSYFFEKLDDTRIKTYEKLKDEFRPLILDIIETVESLSDNQNIADLNESKQNSRKSLDHVMQTRSLSGEKNLHGSAMLPKTRRVTLLPPDTLLRESITKRREKISSLRAAMGPVCPPRPKVDKKDQNSENTHNTIENGNRTANIIKVQNGVNEKDQDVTELYDRNETDLQNLMTRIDQLEKDKSVLQCNINLIEKECKEKMFDLISFVNEEIDKNWFIRNVKVRLNRSDEQTGQLIVTDHNDNTLSLYELSGGQKSLMAVSVMFTAVSFYFLKSHMKLENSSGQTDLQNMNNVLCLFDEIDAALDPSQTERIASFLKTRGCQTIVVSLKEGFWTQADRVYEVYREGMGAKAQRVK